MSALPTLDTLGEIAFSFVGHREAIGESSILALLSLLVALR